MDNYFFLWVKFYTIIINFVAQIVPALAIRSSFKMAAVSFRHALFVGGRGVVGGGLVPNFLVLQDILCSFSSCPVPAIESTISPRNPYSFYGRVVFRNQDMGTRYVHCCCVIIPSRPSLLLA